MEEEIFDLLRGTYMCSVKQVSASKTVITVERKKKLGLKKKVLGLFPIYEYERWNEELSSWKYKSIKFTNNFTGRSRSIGIYICFDQKADTVYWRFAV